MCIPPSGAHHAAAARADEALLARLGWVRVVLPHYAVHLCERDLKSIDESVPILEQRMKGTNSCRRSKMPSSDQMMTSAKECALLRALLSSH